MRFELLLVDLCAAFLKAPAEHADKIIDSWLEKLATFIQVDRIGLWECDPNGRTIIQRHLYARPELGIVPSRPLALDLPWAHEQYRNGNLVVWEHLPRDIPAAAVEEHEHAIRAGAKSLLGIPVHAGPTLFMLTFTNVVSYRTWPKNLIRRLQLVGEIFAGAFVRQRAERSLQASESRMRAILKAMPDLIFVLSPEEVYLECHAPNLQDLLVPPEVFLGRRMDEILPPDMVAKFRAAFRRAADTGQVAEAEYVMPIEGDERHFEARIVRRDDGATVVVVRDITERHRGAVQLSESEQRFRGAFSHSAIGIALVSVDGHWLQVNAALCRILGYPEDALLATTFQALTHPDDLEPDLKLLHRALAGEVSHYEMEKRYIHRDGRIIFAILTVSLVRNDNLEPLYFVSQIQDVTQRRQSEIEIERARLELAHIGRLSLVAQLTASLGHELLQPITAVVSNAEAGLHIPGLADAPETRALLEDIASSGRRAGDIIHHVRGLLRNERGPQVRVDLNRLVQDVAQVMRSDLILHQVSLVMRLDSGAGEISGNSVEMQQVLLNLMLNGTEAMSACAALDRRLVIATVVRKDGVELSVQDSGTGVSPEQLKRLFEPFYTTKPGGMGMGLPICAEIVRAHRGRLWAENNADRGMTMRCQLPRD